MLQIDYPIIQGGMGNISNAQLTAAVSEAGGLGTIGCGTMTPAEVEKIILETKQLTNKRFAVNIAIGVSPYTKELIELVIKHQVPVVSLSAGNPAALYSNFARTWGESDCACSFCEACTKSGSGGRGYIRSRRI